MLVDTRLSVVRDASKRPSGPLPFQHQPNVDSKTILYHLSPRPRTLAENAMNA